MVRPHTLTVPCGLHERLVVVAVAAEHHGQAGHALATDEADFDGLACVGHDGRKAAFGEIDGCDLLVGASQDLSQWKVNRLQVRLDQREIVSRKMGKDEVLLGFGHGAPPIGAGAHSPLSAVRALKRRRTMDWSYTQS